MLHLRSFLGLVAFALPVSGFANIWTEGALDPNFRADAPMTFDVFSKLAAAASPAVVSIETEVAQRQAMDPFMFFWGIEPMERTLKGAGSGFIIDASGYLLTNNHVVEGAEKIEVHLLDGRTFPAELVGTDPATDVALLKLDAGGEGLPIVPLGDSDALQIGEFVAAIGNPLGLAHTLTTGIVSAKSRRDVHPDQRIKYADFIQTDASINPGNSGGPLFNLRGEVIGINTAISAQGQGIGFAIPVNQVKAVLTQLAEEGRVERSWIGVQIQEVTPELAQSFGLPSPKGALIAGVVPGGPGADAKLKKGDVILSFNGKEIRDSADLPLIASTAGIGKTVDLLVFRDGKEKKMEITLGKMPSADENPVSMNNRKGKDKDETVKVESLKVSLAPLSDKLKKKLGVEKGVLVTEVGRGSPARGLRQGDVIVECNGEAVDSPKDVEKMLKSKDKRGIVRLLIQRGSAEIFLGFSL